MDTHRAILVAMIVLLIAQGGIAAAGTAASDHRMTDSGPTGAVDGAGAQVAVVDESPRAAQVDEPETADEFLIAISELESSPAFDEYNAFGVVQTQAVISLQADTFNDDVRTRMRLLLFTLRNFDAAYASMENGSLRESLRMADRTQRNLTRLREAGGTTYATLAEAGLDRFHRDLGDRLHNRSTEADSTPAKLRLLDDAAEAYRAGGASDRFARMSTLRERRAAEFRQDRREMNASRAVATAFLDRCSGACSSPTRAIAVHGVGVFDLYNAGLRAQDDVSAAETIAEDHGLSDQVETFREMGGRVRSAVVNLIAAIAVYAGAYVIAIALPAMFLWSRLSSWARDLRAEQVGSILTAVPATEVRDATG